MKLQTRPDYATYMPHAEAVQTEALTAVWIATVNQGKSFDKPSFHLRIDGAEQRIETRQR